MSMSQVTSKSAAVSHILNSILDSVYKAHDVRSNPTVVDLDAEEQQMHTQEDDDVTVVTEKRCPHISVDDVEIVCAQIIHPSRVPAKKPGDDAIDVDLLEEQNTLPHEPPMPPQSNKTLDNAIDVDVLDLDMFENVPEIQPSVVPVGPPPPEKKAVPDVDIIECETPSASKPTYLPSLTCHACDAHLLKSRPLSRCKHLLCALCRLHSVTDMASKEIPTAHRLRRLPVCVVPRCGAPLSEVEAIEALGPDVADSAFQTAYQVFETWRQAAPENEVSGAANVEFPHYKDLQNRNSAAVSHEKQTLEAASQYEELLEDDLEGALAPLWIWDSEHVYAQSRVGAWLCAACGEYKVCANNDGPSSGTTQQQSDNAPPDAPDYPHCAYARALAVSEYMKSLIEAREEKSPTPKRSKRKRSSTTTKVTRSGKRYKSASSVQASKRKKAGFAKGTGYAGGTGAEWQGVSQKMLEKKTRIDNEVAFWLRRLRCLLLLGKGGLRTWPGFMRILLRESKLVPQLALILINESIMDVQERVPIFVSALRVVHTIAESPQLRSLMVEPSGGPSRRSISELVQSLSQQAAFLTTGTEQNSLPVYTSMLVKQIRRCIRVINRNNLIQIAKEKLNSGTVVVDESTECTDEGNAPEGNAKNEDGTEDVKVGTDLFEEDKAVYIQEMREHQFKAVPGLINSSTFKAKAQEADITGVPHPRRQRRIATEVASLISSLPFSWSSSILIRVDEDRYDILRACIFGPEDTPYDSGAFIFDIYLPLQYPLNPPKFSLLTTGAGKVRFNPNLYSNGKVCLSLLGTWSGPSWNQSSTILQVLVSIQSLIFVSEPYFNEPGYESQIGTSIGKKASDQYNARIRYNTAFHAIQGHVRKPPPEFAEGINTHFRLKRRYLKQRLARWFPNAVEAGKVGGTENDQNTKEQNSAKVTVDPTLQPLNVWLSPTPSTTNASINAALASLANFSGIGHGRSFGSAQMTWTNLNSIFADLDAYELGKF